MSERKIGDIKNPERVFKVTYYSGENKSALEYMAEEVSILSVFSDPQNPGEKLSNRLAVATQDESSKGNPKVWRGTITLGPVTVYPLRKP